MGGVTRPGVLIARVCRRQCHIYRQRLPSEYNGSCPDVRDIHLGLWWHNTPQSPVTIDPRTEKVMPEQHPLQPSEIPFLIRSTSLQRGTDIPLCLSTIDSNTPMFVKALINLGATRMFINIEFMKSKNIWTHQLPRAI